MLGGEEWRGGSCTEKELFSIWLNITVHMNRVKPKEPSEI